MKTRTVYIREVTIRFSIPEYEIDIESNGHNSTPVRFRAKEITLEEAMGEMYRDQIREVGPCEELVVEIDGEQAYPKLKRVAKK